MIDERKEVFYRPLNRRLRVFNYWVMMVSFARYCTSINYVEYLNININIRAMIYLLPSGPTNISCSRSVSGGSSGIWMSIVDSQYGHKYTL